MTWISEGCLPASSRKMSRAFCRPPDDDRIIFQTRLDRTPHMLSTIQDEQIQLIIQTQSAALGRFSQRLPEIHPRGLLAHVAGETTLTTPLAQRRGDTRFTCAVDAFDGNKETFWDGADHGRPCYRMRHTVCKHKTHPAGQRLSTAGGLVQRFKASTHKTSSPQRGSSSLHAFKQGAQSIETGLLCCDTGFSQATAFRPGNTAGTTRRSSL